MNKKIFHAGNWFLKEDYGKDRRSRYDYFAQPLPSEDEIPPIPELVVRRNEAHGKYSKFFTPGWKGEALSSKEILKFKKLLIIFHKDCIRAFKNLGNPPRSMINAIYEDFLAYTEYKAINCTGLDDYQSFWKEIKNESSIYKEQLDGFVRIFSLRACGIYLLKVKLMSTMLEKLEQPFETKYFVYPNSFFTTIFKKGSSTEINASSLESNIYSWYRPGIENEQTFLDIKEVLKNLTDSEIIKHFSIFSESVLSEKAEFSHSLSHTDFGLFLNSLLLHLPNWLANTRQEKVSSYQSKNGNEIVSCLFKGDYIESFASSHWLARHSVYADSNRQLLSPEFKNCDFVGGKFFSIFQQLIYLNFLVQFAAQNNRPIIQFLCDVVNSDYRNKQNSEGLQRSLLGNLSEEVPTYDRVIINLANFPKNNAQHHLINSIYAQEKSLKNGGLLYVLSTKKLFIPSQKSKVEALLEKFKVKGIFTLDEVKGKGEVPSYVYILAKKEQYESLENESLKDTCSSFRFHGTLNSFSQFHQFTLQLLSFLRVNRKEVVPMYQKETETGLRFEFFQDAIVDGRLINSTSKDSSKITHPLFFKNLMSKCNPFDFFFEIQPINFKEENLPSNAPLDMGEMKKAYKFVLIVDKRISNNGADIEIISSASLEAKAYEYGHSRCFYFGILPKWQNISLNAVEEFYRTKIGKQILDLTFTNDTRKIKSSLSKLLLPTFFIAEKQIPEHVLQGINLLLQSEQGLMDTHPTELRSKFQNIELLSQDLVQRYPGATLSLFASFKKNLKNCVDKMDFGSKAGINFNNPLLKSPLLLSKTRPIYPSNQDLFIQFVESGVAASLHSNLQRVKRKSTTGNDVTTNCLILYANEREVLAIYSEPEMLMFLEFILTNVTGASISKILQAITVPTLADLKSIIHNYKFLKKTFEEVLDQTTPFFEKIITTAISK